MDFNLLAESVDDFRQSPPVHLAKRDGSSFPVENVHVFVAVEVADQREAGEG